jgi:uncharacterized membrane protein
MLRTLQTVLTEKHPSPARVAAGLRQALLAVYASQVGLILLTAFGVWLIGAPAPRDLGWSWLLLGLSALIYGCIAFFAEREFGRTPSLKSGLQLAMLLGIASALPAIFALLVMVLEGLRLGAWLLWFASLQALIFAALRLTLVAYRIPQRQDDEDASSAPEAASPPSSS